MYIKVPSPTVLLSPSQPLCLRTVRCDATLSWLSIISHFQPPYLRKVPLGWVKGQKVGLPGGNDEGRCALTHFSFETHHQDPLLLNGRRPAPNPHISLVVIPDPFHTDLTPHLPGRDDPVGIREPGIGLEPLKALGILVKGQHSARWGREESGEGTRRPRRSWPSIPTLCRPGVPLTPHTCPLLPQPSGERRHASFCCPAPHSSRPRSTRSAEPTRARACSWPCSVCSSQCASFHTSIPHLLTP